MAAGLGEQLESLGRATRERSLMAKPWQLWGRASRQWFKTIKARRERRRARQDPECMPHYHYVVLL